MSTIARRLAKIALPVFEEQGWKYGYDNRTPTLTELTNGIDRLVQHLREDPEIPWISCGRFTVLRREGGIEVMLELTGVDPLPDVPRREERA